uniref:Uncharacterized protein n=1 Tax=Bionectria ochroleuca TaxID=29856 RepID=A0A0B7KFA0_BIOOC
MTAELDEVNTKLLTESHTLHGCINGALLLQRWDNHAFEGLRPILLLKQIVQPRFLGSNRASHSETQLEQEVDDVGRNEAISTRNEDERALRKCV